MTQQLKSTNKNTINLTGPIDHPIFPTIPDARLQTVKTNYVPFHLVFKLTTSLHSPVTRNPNP